MEVISAELRSGAWLQLLCSAPRAQWTWLERLVALERTPLPDGRARATGTSKSPGTDGEGSIGGSGFCRFAEAVCECACSHAS